MSPAEWLIGVCLFIAAACLGIFLHGITHPRKRDARPLLTYDLTHKRLGVLFGTEAPDSNDGTGENADGPDPE